MAAEESHFAIGLIFDQLLVGWFLFYFIYPTAESRKIEKTAKTKKKRACIRSGQRTMS